MFVMDLISVVITTYKRQLAILERAIKSVTNQTYDNIELIVINDYPDDIAQADNIREMVKAIDPECVYIVNEKNIGAASSRNIAIAEAKGKYIAFLDDDDEWLPDKLEKQYKIISADSSVGLVYGNYLLVDDKKAKNVRVINPRNPIKELVKMNFIGSTSIPLINLEILRKVGGFDGSLKMGQDYDLWLRIALISKLEYINEPLIKYFVSNDSTFRFNHQNRVISEQYWNNKYNDIFKKYKIARCYGLNMSALRTITNGNKDFKAFFSLKKMAIKLEPFYIFNYIFIPAMLVQELKWHICHS